MEGSFLCTDSWFRLRKDEEGTSTTFPPDLQIFYPEKSFFIFRITASKGEKASNLVKPCPSAKCCSLKWAYSGKAEGTCNQNDVLSFFSEKSALFLVWLMYVLIFSCSDCLFESCKYGKIAVYTTLTE